MNKETQITSTEMGLCPHGNSSESCESCKEARRKIQFFLDLCNEKIDKQELTTHFQIDQLEQIIRETREDEINLDQFGDIDNEIQILHEKAANSVAKGAMEKLKLAKENSQNTGGGRDLILEWRNELANITDKHKEQIGDELMKQIATLLEETENSELSDLFQPKNTIQDIQEKQSPKDAIIQCFNFLYEAKGTNNHNLIEYWLSITEKMLKDNETNLDPEHLKIYQSDIKKLKKSIKQPKKDQ